MRINKHDTNGTKPLLGKGELGYDDYTAGGDTGRVYVGTGTENIALAEKLEVDSHVSKVDNPHSVTKAQVGLGNVDNTADANKNVLSAAKWTTARTITLSGDVTGSVSMDGTANVSITTTVQPNSVALGTDTTGNYVAGITAGTGITVSGTASEGWSPTVAITNVGTAGTYTKVTTNAQGQVTSGTSLAATDIPDLDASKITSGTIDAARLPAYVDDVLEFANLASFPATGESGKIYVALDTNKTYRWSGSVYVYITSGAVDSVNGQTGVVNITTITGNSGTATKLQTARTINGVSFDGTANITVTDSTKLSLTGGTLTGALTGTTFTGTSFNSITALSSTTPLVAGTAAIGTSTTVARADHVHPVQTSVSGNAGTATKLTTARTISLTGDVTGSVLFDGSADASISATIAANSVALGTDTTGNYVAGVTAGQGITISGTAGEGWSPTIALSALDLTLFPTSNFKKSVKVATTANITLSGVQTIDGISVVAGDRVLVKDQTTASQNGIYIVNASTWTRSVAADGANEIDSAVVGVDQGTTNGGRFFTNTFKTTDTVGTTAMPWYEVATTSSTVSSANTLATARTVQTNLGSTASASFNGSANITPGVTGTLPVSNGGTGATTLTGLVKGNGTSAMSVAVAGTDYVVPSGSITGNASTTTTLQTARTISGVSFNGSANIDIEDRLGTAIASAATTTIGTRGLGDYIHITGTTTITSFGTAAAAGVRRTLIFDGALTLTHNATSLICPGSANIVTVAGTIIEVVAETTANWRVVSITHPSLSMAELSYLDGVTSAIQTQLNAKAALASPALTGTPTAPTAAVGTSTTQIASTAFVNAEIANDAVLKVISTDNAIVRFNGTTGDVQNSNITIDDLGNLGNGTQTFNGFGGTGFKNYIINGNFDIWQRGITQTSSDYGSDDRWRNGNAGSTKTHSRVACTDTERALFNASYFSRTVVSSVAGANNQVLKEQYIEDVTRLAGKTVTLSFWAKANSNKNIGVNIAQVFGTGGSPSNIVYGTTQIVALTSTWQKKSITVTIPSIVGKTLGTDGAHTSFTALQFYFDQGSATTGSVLGQQSGTFDIAQVQLEEGSVATPFENRPIGLELGLCQRYYEVIDGHVIEVTASSAGEVFNQTTGFNTKKRVQPTLTMIQTNSSNNPTINIGVIAAFGFYKEIVTTAAGVSYSIDTITASAEL